MRVHQASLLIALALTLLRPAAGKSRGARPCESAGAGRRVSGAPHPKLASARRARQRPMPENPLTMTRLNEDGSETVEEVPGRHRCAEYIVGGGRLDGGCRDSSRSAAAASSATAWQDGVNYTRLVPAQPTSVPAGQVEVLEFFWYACPHCYALDPWSRPGENPSRPTSAFHACPCCGTKAIARLRVSSTRCKAWAN